MTGRPPVLLLDAGNTLVFLDEQAVADVLAADGVAVRTGAVRDAQGPAKRRYEQKLRSGVSHDDGWFLYMETLLVAAGVEGDVRAHVRSLRAAHDELNLWRRVPEGLTGALGRLRDAGTRLGVISNSEGAIDALLVHVGLRSHFEVVVDSGVEGISKPDPEIFRRALTRMGDVPATDAVYVGDVPGVDVDGARAAGLEGVLVDAFDHYADYDDALRVRSVSELVRRWLGD